MNNSQNIGLAIIFIIAIVGSLLILNFKCQACKDNMEWIAEGVVHCPARISALYERCNEYGENCEIVFIDYLCSLDPSLPTCNPQEIFFSNEPF
jgi:hypothetical protein